MSKASTKPENEKRAKRPTDVTENAFSEEKAESLKVTEGTKSAATIAVTKRDSAAGKGLARKSTESSKIKRRSKSVALTVPAQNSLESSKAKKNITSAAVKVAVKRGAEKIKIIHTTRATRKRAESSKRKKGLTKKTVNHAVKKRSQLSTRRERPTSAKVYVPAKKKVGSSKGEERLGTAVKVGAEMKAASRKKINGTNIGAMTDVVNENAESSKGRKRQNGAGVNSLAKRVESVKRNTKAASAPLKAETNVKLSQRKKGQTSKALQVAAKKIVWPSKGTKVDVACKKRFSKDRLNEDRFSEGRSSEDCSNGDWDESLSESKPDSSSRSGATFGSTSEAGIDLDEDEEEEEDEKDEMRVQRIIASKILPWKEWRAICKKMNTSEIEDGSRWVQHGDEEENDDTIEERFLVKWADLGYLHCSWERESDLIEQIENAKTYLAIFERKAVDGLLFRADERGDGEFFDPSFLQIERMLEVTQPDDKDAKECNQWGMIFDKDNPDYANGRGRQFLIKWVNQPYSEATYEFERDMIENDIEYESHLKSLLRRSKKPTKAMMSNAVREREKQMRRLYETFGKSARISGEVKAELVKAYRSELEVHVFKNGGQLRDYQAEGVSWLVSNLINRHSSLLADEMGLGKTIQTAIFINFIVATLHNRGPFLIVVPLSTLPHWLREFEGWTSLNTVVFHGSSEDRDVIRQYEFPFEEDRPDQGKKINGRYLNRCHPKNCAGDNTGDNRTWKVQVVITTPEMLIRDDFVELATINWEVLVVDEAHRLKSFSSKLASNLRKRFTYHHTLLLTGTPIQNNMEEMFALLHFIDPKKFYSCDAFLELYGDIKSKDRLDDLHDQIRPYILRRLKEDVEQSVPPKEETLIAVELTVLQKQYYRALYEKNVSFLHRSKKKAMDGPSLRNLAMQLRKCCNHPFLLNGVEEEKYAESLQARSNATEGDFLANASGKLILLDKLLPNLKQNGHRLLIFSQFTMMLDILEDYLSARSYSHERIDGNITGVRRQNAIDRFQSKAEDGKEGIFIMLLSTRAGGVGINLTAADTCIIFDSDFNPQVDIQAQARCHRIGQTKSVKVYRLLSHKSYEHHMFFMSSLKLGLDQAVLHGVNKTVGGKREGELSKEEIERLLRYGAYDLFKEEKAGRSEEESKEFAAETIESILARRSKIIVHEHTGVKSGAAGGVFSKANFIASSDKANCPDEIDIDDPLFWTKTLGEFEVEDDLDIIETKRRRREVKSYREVVSEASSAESSTDSVESDGHSGFESDFESSATMDESDDETNSKTKKGDINWKGEKPAHMEKLNDRGLRDCEMAPECCANELCDDVEAFDLTMNVCVQPEEGRPESGHSRKNEMMMMTMIAKNDMMMRRWSSDSVDNSDSSDEQCDSDIESSDTMEPRTKERKQRIQQGDDDDDIENSNSVRECDEEDSDKDTESSDSVQRSAKANEQRMERIEHTKNLDSSFVICNGGHDVVQASVPSDSVECGQREREQSNRLDDDDGEKSFSSFEYDDDDDGDERIIDHFHEDEIVDLCDDDSEGS